MYEMANASADGNSEYLHWVDDGTSFWISNIDAFARDILPLYFKHNRYASFVRQLNFYGFKRISRPQGRVVPGAGLAEMFHHPSFQRGNPNLLSNIYRKQSVSAGSLRPSSTMPEFPTFEDETPASTEPRPRSASITSPLQSLKEEFSSLQTHNVGMTRALVDIQKKYERLRTFIHEHRVALETLYSHAGRPLPTLTPLPPPITITSITNITNTTNDTTTANTTTTAAPKHALPRTPIGDGVGFSASVQAIKPEEEELFDIDHFDLEGNQDMMFSFMDDTPITDCASPFFLMPHGDDKGSF